MQPERENTTILAIDHDGRLEPVVDALRSAGFGTVDTVADVGAAEQEVASRSIDVLLILDAPPREPLEKVDGPTQLREIRTLMGDIPVMVYVLSNGHRPLIECFEAGADDVCRAPPAREELIARKVEYVAEPESNFDDPETQFQSLIESHPLEIFIKDSTGRFANLTARSGIFEEFEREWITNLTDYEFFDPAFADDLYEEEQELLDSEEAVVDKVEHYVDETGQDRWSSTTKAPRYDEDGTLLGIVGSTLDVSDVKRQERLMAALHEASRRLTRSERPPDIARTTVDIAADIGPLPRVQVALFENGELQPISGGHEVRASQLSTPPFETHEHWYRTAAGGTSLYVAPSGDPVPDLDDEIEVCRTDDRIQSGLFVPLGEHGVVGFVDNNDRFDAFTVELSHVLAANVRASLDQAVRERRLAETNERLREFALLGSHELRNRLQSAYGRLAKLDEETDSEQVAELERIIEGFERMVTRLVTLARTGSVVETTESVDMESVARAAWREIDADPASLQIEGSAQIVANSGELRELFGHLFENAIEHAGPDVTVTVGLLREGSGFYVADDGPGIPEDRVDAVFEFDYDDAASRSGYGLYIVSTIASAHDWDVRAVDRNGARIEIRGVEQTQEKAEPGRPSRLLD